MSEVDTEVQEIPRGDRGIVGVATPSKTIRKMWHEATHLRVDASTKQNPRKQRWVPKNDAPSLKQFARELAAKGDPTAKEWFANKRGDNNQKRTDANIGRANLERAATRASRRKNAETKKNKTKKAEETPATIVTKR